MAVKKSDQVSQERGGSDIFLYKGQKRQKAAEGPNLGNVICGFCRKKILNVQSPHYSRSPHLSPLKDTLDKSDSNTLVPFSSFHQFSSSAVFKST